MCGCHEEKTQPLGFLDAVSRDSRSAEPCSILDHDSLMSGFFRSTGVVQFCSLSDSARAYKHAECTAYKQHGCHLWSFVDGDRCVRKGCDPRPRVQCIPGASLTVTEL